MVFVPKKKILRLKKQHDFNSDCCVPSPLKASLKAYFPFSQVPSDAEVLRACCFAVHGWDDGGFSNTSNVIVHVKDLNDNRPKFVNSSYTGSVDEGSGRGSEVLDLFNKPLVVEASDADSGENSRIVFSIVEASASHSFEIDSKTGKLSTKRVCFR